MARETQDVCATLSAITFGEEGFVHSNYDVLFAWVSKCSEDQYCLLPRSLIWSSLHMYFHNALYMLMMKNTLLSKGVPISVVDFQLSYAWYDNAKYHILGTLKALCAHRFRVLRRLEKCVQDWQNVMEDACTIDLLFAQACHGRPVAEDEYMKFCKNWTIEQIGKILNLYCGVLMEMELPSEEECAYIFWYRASVASTIMVSNTR